MVRIYINVFCAIVLRHSDRNRIHLRCLFCVILTEIVRTHICCVILTKIVRTHILCVILTEIVWIYMVLFVILREFVWIYFVIYIVMTEIMWISNCVCVIFQKSSEFKIVCCVIVTKIALFCYMFCSSNRNRMKLLFLFKLCVTSCSQKSHEFVLLFASFRQKFSFASFWQTYNEFTFLVRDSDRNLMNLYWLSRHSERDRMNLH